MKRVSDPSQSYGFTMVETMIFLVVSVALLISAMLLIAGKQRKTEFTQAINQFESVIKDQLNDVATGFYPSTDNVVCMASSTDITLTTGTKEQGTNSGCIFAGKVIELMPGGNKHAINVHIIAGRRLKNFQDVTSLADATPRLLSSDLPTPLPSEPNIVETIDLTPAISIGSVTASYLVPDPSDPSNPLKVTTISVPNVLGIGIFSTFRPQNISASTNPDNLSADIAAFTFSPPPAHTGAFVGQIESRIRSGPSPNYLFNPNQGIAICINSEGTNQSALLLIGAGSSGITGGVSSGVSTRIDRFEKRNCV